MKRPESLQFVDVRSIHGQGRLMALGNVACLIVFNGSSPRLAEHCREAEPAENVLAFVVQPDEDEAGLRQLPSKP